MQWRGVTARLPYAALRARASKRVPEYVGTKSTACAQELQLHRTTPPQH